MICHVEGCLEGALSDMQLVFFFRGALGGDRDFLLIGTVFDAMCFARPLFQRAARRMAHCLFVVALHGWICLCFRRVVASVQSFGKCVLREVGHRRDFSWLWDSWSDASRGF